jgi:predicted CoA-binding protein
VTFRNPSQDEIKMFLASVRTVAVVGLSPDPDRPSYSVAMYLQNNGYRILPVRPGGGVLLSEPVSERLTDLRVQVDLVDCFRNSRLVGPHVDEAIAIGARGVWLQEGVIDEAAAERARSAGLFVVMDRCVLKEHRKAGLSNSRPPQSGRPGSA